MKILQKCSLEKSQHPCLLGGLNLNMSVLSKYEQLAVSTHKEFTDKNMFLLKYNEKEIQTILALENKMYTTQKIYLRYPL